MNGNYNNLIEWGRAIILTIICFIMAVSVALFIVINVSPCFISLPVSKLGISNSEIYADYWRVVKYLQIPWDTQLKLKYIPITQTAIQHFKDVRHLFIFNECLMILSTPVTFWGLKKEKRQGQLWRLNLPFQLILMMISVAGFMIFTSFDDCFIKFHYLVFNNMDWVFTPMSNPIILIMPESFFSTLFILFAIISVLIISCVWIWARHQLSLLFRKL